MNSDECEIEEKRNGNRNAGWMVIALVAGIIGVSGYFMFVGTGGNQKELAVDMNDVKQAASVASANATVGQ